MLVLNAQENKISISGTIVETHSSQPLSFATVAVYNKTTNEIISGTTTDEDGKFQIVVNSANIYLEISYLGFQSKKIDAVSSSQNKLDLGVIKLSEDGQMLDEVNVRAEKSQTEFKLDKRVFNVGQDLSSTGASALEVLNNVPSVNVNIEGEISLRGSGGVQVLINGKPSVLASDDGNALGSITADMIEKIEVITNPSAKYEAGGTSGIINIVIKKEERRGANGSISFNTGYPHNHSVGLSLNRRTEKFNMFSQLGGGYRSLPRENENINTDYSEAISIVSDGKNYRNEGFVNLTLGADYHIDSTSVFTISGNFAYEFEKQPSTTNYRQFEGVDEVLTKEWQREEATEAKNPKWQYELQYKKNLKKHENHALLVGALGSFFGKKQSSDFEDITLLGGTENDYERSNTAFKEAKYTFHLDYTKPFSEKFVMEVGSQYVLQDVSNDYSVSTLIANNWENNNSLTNVFEYRQDVLGIYSTGAYEGDKWGVKLGLRMEYSHLNTLLANTDESNTRNYIDFFPTFHTSYKISDQVSLQAGYSRRIFRPRLWDLNPFFNIRDNYTIRTGNPNLQPELSNSTELNSIYIFKKASLNLGIYHLHTTDIIEQVSVFEDNVNTYMPMNIGIKHAFGTEFNTKFNPAKWMTLTSDFNYNYFIRKGEFEGESFDFNAHKYTAKLTTKFKIPADFDLEITANYESKYKEVQRQVSDNLHADIGVRKKFKDGKAIISVSVRDVFASRNRESEILDDDFYVYSLGQRGRFITLGFSYGFGKGEAMEYSGRRR
ncbi:MAG: outer membrane beta-barrel family protein [Chitinophagales bacterium]